jgi:hypothetical protein
MEAVKFYRTGAPSNHLQAIWESTRRARRKSGVSVYETHAYTSYVLVTTTVKKTIAALELEALSSLYC